MPTRLPPSLRIVDSITELTALDAGCIAVSGSHGGVSSAKYAIAARPLLSVFNDAGVGKDAAGIAALALLQDHELAACTVAHDSARIGQALSSLQSGIITHCNGLAMASGLLPGQPLEHALQQAWPCGLSAQLPPAPASTSQE